MQPSRPNFTASYGIAQDDAGLLPWSHAVERLTAARNYWLATTRPDGRPHVAAVWGAWVADAFYFGTETGSVKARNLDAHPTLVVHLESGDDVVILEGVPEIIPDPAAIPGLDAAYLQKYGMGVASAGGEGDASPRWYALRPTFALGWIETDFATTATRWVP